jgi:hypothetical protein
MNTKNNTYFNKYIQYVLENFQCSYCNEYNYVNPTDIKNTNDNESNSEEYLNWNLYLKEFEDYSALILSHSIYKKDVIELFKKYNFKRINELVLLEENNNNRFITLEFVSKNDDENTSIWVPSENDLPLYERIIDSNKKYDKNMDAYFIGKYNLKKI